jgi:hypothetical protein
MVGARGTWKTRVASSAWIGAAEALGAAGFGGVTGANGGGVGTGRITEGCIAEEVDISPPAADRGEMENILVNPPGSGIGGADAAGDAPGSDLRLNSSVGILQLPALPKLSAEALVAGAGADGLPSHSSKLWGKVHSVVTTYEVPS